jgi:hypothetical protein
MAQEPLHSVHDRGTPRRRWWQFSILNLILVTVIVCVTAAYLRSRQEIIEQRQAMQVERAKHDARLAEIKRLKDQFGYLTVTDKTKLYIQARPNEGEFHWRWRIYLPSDAEKWNFVLASGKVRSDGFDAQRWDHVPARRDSQVDVELSIERVFSGSLRRHITVRGDDFSSTRTGVVLEEDLQSLLSSIRTKGVSQRGLSLLELSADEPVALLRVVSTDTPVVEKGLIFFVEKVPR